MVRRRHPVPLYVVCPASSQRNYFSSSLVGFDMIDEILFIFPAGTGLQLIYQIFACSQPLTDNTKVPIGNELTSGFVPTGQFVGDNICYSLPFEFKLPDNTPYLALYATNNVNTQLPAAIVAILEREE
jgi:hypothetical protein